MRDIAAQLSSWLSEDRAVGLATVVGVRGSAPRDLGASMGVVEDGTIIGSVSGGCVEGAVLDVAQQVLSGGEPRIVSYGISDEDAFAVGLTCGGTIEVLVQRVAGERAALLQAVATSLAVEEPVAVATVVAVTPAAAAGGDSGDRAPGVGATLAIWPNRMVGGLGDPRLDAAVATDATGLLAHGRTARLRYGALGERLADEVTVLVESFAPRPRMLVFGAVDFAAAVSRMGAFLGYAVTVCDARAAFATPARFPEADEVVVAWPHRYLAGTDVDARTVICVLTHDPKFDVPLLEVALRGPAAYVGAMGSRRTHGDRLMRLRERGLGDAELARLRSPIGLDLSGRSPEETAVSIAAEIVALRWGGTGAPLSATSGSIHAERVAPVP